MTFSEWMAQNGYGQYNSAAGRRELQKQYGITETDSAKANMALWAKLKAGEQAPSEPVKREVVAPMATKVTPLTITAPQPKQIIIPEQYQKLFYNQGDDTYYGGRFGEVVAKKRKVSNKERKEAYNEWLTEAIDNPEVLFNPNLTNYRKGISNKVWQEIITKHPEYFNEKYARYIPDKVQSWAFNRGIRQATEQAAPLVAATVTGFMNPLAALGSVVGSTATNEAVNAATDGKHKTWGSAAADVLGVESELGQNLLELTNIGGLALGGFGNRALAASNVSTKVPLTEKTIVGTEKPFYRQIQVKGSQPHTKTIATTEKIALNNPDAVIPNRPQYTNNLDIVHQVPVTRTIQVRGSAPHVRNILKVPGLVGENAANAGLNAPIVLPGFTSNNSERTILLPQTEPVLPEWQLPEINYYNTARDWGSADFQKWWRENATEENAGKTLNYNGKPIKITWSPTGYRTTNLGGNVGAGLYPSGTVTDKLVLNREPLVYTGDRIGYQQVGVTPAVFVPNQNVYGGTVTLAQGGKVNYLDYTH